MKARQTLKHASLIQEVIQQLNRRFQPTISRIKVDQTSTYNSEKSFFF